VFIVSSKHFRLGEDILSEPQVFNEVRMKCEQASLIVHSLIDRLSFRPVSGAPENSDLPDADQVYTKDVKTVCLVVTSRRGFGADFAVHTHSVRGKESEKGAEDGGQTKGGGAKPVDEIPSSPSQALDDVRQ
jgi:hypothetical protein